MNCKLHHDELTVRFEYDEWTDPAEGKKYKTVITFNKSNKTFSVHNGCDFYGHGSCMRVKEMNHAQKYLRNKNLLD